MNKNLKRVLMISVSVVMLLNIADNAIVKNHHRVYADRISDEMSDMSKTTAKISKNDDSMIAHNEMEEAKTNPEIAENSKANKDIAYLKYKSQINHDLNHFSQTNKKSRTNYDPEEAFAEHQAKIDEKQEHHDHVQGVLGALKTSPQNVEALKYDYHDIYETHKADFRQAEKIANRMTQKQIGEAQANNQNNYLVAIAKAEHKPVSKIKHQLNFYHGHSSKQIKPSRKSLRRQINALKQQLKKLHRKIRKAKKRKYHSHRATRYLAKLNRQYHKAQNQLKKLTTKPARKHNVKKSVHHHSRRAARKNKRLSKHARRRTHRSHHLIK